MILGKLEVVLHTVANVRRIKGKTEQPEGLQSTLG